MSVCLCRDLADNFKVQGRNADAEKMFKQVIDLRTEVLGAKDKRTLGTIVDMAIAIENQGRRTEAEALYRQMLKARSDTLGPEAPETINSVMNVAICLYGQVKGRHTV